MPKGITKCCPSCHKILIRDIEPDSKGKFRMRCPHCNRTFDISVEHKTVIVICECGENNIDLKKGHGV